MFARMTELAYIGFVFVAMLLGAAYGVLAHFFRAHGRPWAEDLGLGETLNTMTRNNYQFEKHVVGAEWDDAGFWEPGSPRNLLYYVISWTLLPLAFGALFWFQRAPIVGWTCKTLGGMGLMPPLCP
jgi:hypothetical protein